MHLANLSELHIQDAGVPGFRKFLSKYEDDRKLNDPDLFVQFTDVRPMQDKRHAGELKGHTDVHGLLSRQPVHNPSYYVLPRAGGKFQVVKQQGEGGREETLPKLYNSKGEAKQAVKHLEQTDKDQNIRWRLEAPPHGDPIGLYAYPLEYVVHHPYDIAYGAGFGHLRVIRRRPECKTMRLQKASWSDVEHLTKVMNLSIGAEELKAWRESSDWERSKQRAGMKMGTPGEFWWFILQRPMTAFKNQGQPHDIKFAGVERTRSQEMQATIVRRAGYDAIQDEANGPETAIIYPEEPEQIVFVNRNAYDAVDEYTLGKEVRRLPGQGDIGMPKRTKGIASTYTGMIDEGRRFAETVAKVMGDKVVKQISMDKAPDSLEAAFTLNLMPGFAGALWAASEAGQAGAKGGIDERPHIRDMFETKRGVMSLEISPGKDNHKNGHRSLDKYNNHRIQIEYIDDKGFTKTTALSSMTVEEIAREHLLSIHPVQPWGKDKPKDIEAAVTQDVSAKIRALARWWRNDGPGLCYDDLKTFQFGCVTFTQGLNSIAEIVGAEPVEVSDNIEETAAILGWGFRVLADEALRILCLEMAKEMKHHGMKASAVKPFIGQFNKFFEDAMKGTSSFQPEDTEVVKLADYRPMMIWMGQPVEINAQERKAMDLFKWAILAVPELAVREGIDKTKPLHALTTIGRNRLKIAADTGLLKDMDPKHPDNSVVDEKFISAVDLKHLLSSLEFSAEWYKNLTDGLLTGRDINTFAETYGASPEWMGLHRQWLDIHTKLAQLTTARLRPFIQMRLVSDDTPMTDKDKRDTLDFIWKLTQEINGAMAEVVKLKLMPTFLRPQMKTVATFIWHTIGESGMADGIAQVLGDRPAWNRETEEMKSLADQIWKLYEAGELKCGIQVARNRAAGSEAGSTAAGSVPS